MTSPTPQNTEPGRITRPAELEPEAWLLGEDAPGGSESGDALALAELVDRVVVVAAARQDRADVVARTHRWLAREAHREPVVVLAG